MTRTNRLNVQGDSGGNGTYLTNRLNDAALRNLIGEGCEVIRYNSGQVKPKPHDLVFSLFYNN